MATCPECDSYKIDQLNDKWRMACRDCGTTFRLYPQNQKGGINLDIGIVLKDIDLLRSKISECNMAIREKKEEAIERIKNELEDTKTHIKVLKNQKKSVKKA